MTIDNFFLEIDGINTPKLLGKTEGRTPRIGEQMEFIEGDLQKNKKLYRVTKVVQRVYKKGEYGKGYFKNLNTGQVYIYLEPIKSN